MKKRPGLIHIFLKKVYCLQIPIGISNTSIGAHNNNTDCMKV